MSKARLLAELLSSAGEIDSSTYTDTDTVYDDTGIQAEVDLNTAKETNVDHPLVETAVPVGAVFTDTNTTYSVQDGELSQNNFTNDDHTKLNGIEASANNYSHPANHAISVISGLQTALDGKVDDSQVLTNVPSGALFTDTNTTYSVGDGGLTEINFTTADNTKLDGIEANATADQTKADIDALNIDSDTLDGQHGSYYTSYADTAVANLVASAPSTLNTLNELADALGDDANFSTTMATALAGKVDDSQVLTNVPSGALFTDTNTTYSVGDNGLTQKNFTSTLKTKLDGIATSANNYSHPTYNGDDFSVDTGALTGATVVSDIDINVTTDGSGHVTDANGSVSTRTLTLANLGYTGATDANNYSHPTSAGNKHIPTGGATDQILKYSSSGTAVWADPAGGGSFPGEPDWTSPTTTLTGTGTWTKPGSIGDDDWVFFYLVGGGGGGNGYNPAMGGGGGGAAIVAVQGVNIPSTVAYVCGAGGSTYSNPTDGGDTTMGSGNDMIVAGGGAGGYVKGAEGGHGSVCVPTNAFGHAITGVSGSASSIRPRDRRFGATGGGYEQNGTNTRGISTFAGNGGIPETGQSTPTAPGGGGCGGISPSAHRTAGAAGNIRIYY